MGYAPLAQLVEQLTLNQWAQGSSPWRCTRLHPVCCMRTGFFVLPFWPPASSKGAIESLAKCLDIENAADGISFHLFHPPLTDTASASGLPIPKEFKADPKKVGYRLAEHFWSRRFVICHSPLQAVQMAFSYRHPLYIGRLMTQMAMRARNP